MQFERIRKNHKKKILIGGLILVCIISAITITTSRAKYKLIEDIQLVRGTINYKVPDLRAVAIKTSEDGINYTEVGVIPTSGYMLNSEKSVCKVATETSGIENALKDNNITIEYKDGKINFLGVTKKGTRCYLYFDKKDTDTVHVAFGEIEVKKTTPDFSKIADTNEGIFAVEDGMYGGTSYYWRGAVTNNYLKFGGYCWRIIRINGDGSIRLIYDGTTCHANGKNSDSISVNNVMYNSNCDKSEYVGYTYKTGNQRTTSGTSSNAKIQTEKWFSSNLSSFDTFIANGKYCNDRDVESGYSWSSQPVGKFYYATRRRLESVKIPTLACPSGDVYTLKVGLITADEVAFAGGVYETKNDLYYLYNGEGYWTMSPYMWQKSDSYSSSDVFFLIRDGRLRADSVYWGSEYSGIRPVINLRSDLTFISGGNGTLNNPYVVS